MAGCTRFTVLTDAVVRMEFSPAQPARFYDSASLAVLNRKLPVPKFTVSFSYPKLEIETANFVLTCNNASAQSSGGFNSANLQIALKVAPGTTWTPGTKPAGNLVRA